MIREYGSPMTLREQWEHLLRLRLQVLSVQLQSILAENEMRSSTDPRMALREFVLERNHILLRGTPDDLKLFLRKRKMPVPKNKEVLVITWHKSITAAMDLPRDYRQMSKDWLDVRGYTSLDVGDLEVRVTHTEVKR